MSTWVNCLGERGKMVKAYGNQLTLCMGADNEFELVLVPLVVLLIIFWDVASGNSSVSRTIPFFI